MTRGAISLLLLTVLPLAAAEDAREILRRALERNWRNDEIARNYTFLQRQENRALDGSGSIKHRESKTWDITLLEGSPFKRLVQRDDKPLPPKEEAREQENLKRSIELRRKETPEQRQQRIADWERKRKDQQNDLEEIPEAFDLTLAGEDTVDGIPAWIIQGTPRPGYKPKSRTTTYYLKMKGRIWVSKTDYQLIQLEAQSTDTISIGGFLIRLQKGARVRVQFAYINKEVWLPKFVGLTGEARILLVKGLRLDTDFTFTNYKKFSTDSRLVPTIQ
jgi:hypothetical protein